MELQALFGSRIRSIRESANLSRETVAERAKISANYLGEIERGEKRPKLDMIGRIANALEVAPAVLFDYDAEEVDNDILLRKLQLLISALNTEQLQQALRVLRTLFPAIRSMRSARVLQGQQSSSNRQA